MNCERCINIHDAQKSGSTNEPCKCSCHTPKPLGTTNIPFTWTYTDNRIPINQTYYTPRCNCSTQPCENHNDMWAHQCSFTSQPHILPTSTSMCPNCSTRRLSAD